MALSPFPDYKGFRFIILLLGKQALFVLKTRMQFMIFPG